METTTKSVPQKSVIAPTRDEVAKARKVLEDLLNSAALGVTATGLIEAAEPPTLISGVSKKSGGSYSFWNRRIVLKVGRDGQTVLVAQSRDKETDFEPLDMGGIVSFVIGGARMDGSQMVLREETPLEYRRK